MSAARGTLIIFAKHPVPCAVKTRMVPPLTPAQAAEFYACLLDDVIEASAAIAEACDLDPVLAVAPASACESMATRCPDGFRVVAQCGEDLGARMERALQQAAEWGARPILLRGSDSPTLDVALVGAALRALRSHDIVVCPDRDGGYSLIGANGAAPGLFAHPMSTDSVLDDTLAGARQRGLRSFVLPPHFDLDRSDDLRWLASARSESTEALCPRTIAYLDREDLWPPPAARRTPRT